MSESHIFTLSGLGQYPFTLVSEHSAEMGNTFWCEHCGTMLKNRHFIRSNDGKISVVGIDCLKRSGDQGLIDAEKELRVARQQVIRETSRLKRLGEAEEKQRQLNNGKTNSERCDELRRFIGAFESELEQVLDSHPLVDLLSSPSNFELSILSKAYSGKSLSQGQLTAIKKVCAKKLSRSRVNSKAYQAAYPAACDLVEQFQVVLKVFESKIEACWDEIRMLHQRQ
jgi:hypothetical protein